MISNQFDDTKAYKDYKRELAWAEASRAFNERQDILGLLASGFIGLLVATAGSRFCSFYYSGEIIGFYFIKSMVVIMLTMFLFSGVWSAFTAKRRRVRARRRMRYYEELCNMMDVEP